MRGAAAKDQERTEELFGRGEREAVKERRRHEQHAAKPPAAYPRSRTQTYTACHRASSRSKQQKQAAEASSRSRRPARTHSHTAGLAATQSHAQQHARARDRRSWRDRCTCREKQAAAAGDELAAAAPAEAGCGGARHTRASRGACKSEHIKSRHQVRANTSRVGIK